MQWNLKNWKEWQINNANQALEQNYINFFCSLGQTCLLLALDSSYISVSLCILNYILKNILYIKEYLDMTLGSAEKDFERHQLGLGLNIYYLFYSKHLGRQNTLYPQHCVPTSKNKLVITKIFFFHKSAKVQGKLFVLSMHSVYFCLSCPP